jgi:hypothetical protein
LGTVESIDDKELVIQFIQEKYNPSKFPEAWNMHAVKLFATQYRGTTQVDLREQMLEVILELAELEKTRRFVAETLGEHILSNLSQEVSSIVIKYILNVLTHLFFDASNTKLIFADAGIKALQLTASEIQCLPDADAVFEAYFLVVYMGALEGMETIYPVIMCC